MNPSDQNSNRNDADQVIERLLNVERRANFDDTSQGRVLVVDSQTGRLRPVTPQEATQAQQRSDAIPLQKVGPYACK